MGLKSIFTEHLGLKLMSLILALLLEAYFYSPDNSITSDVLVPVEFKNISPSMIIVKPRGAEKSTYARVTLRGPAPLVEQTKSANNKFVIDLNQTTQEAFLGSVNLNQLKMPSGVSADVDPDHYELELERLLKKELTVVLKYDGEVAKGYTITAIETIPKTVIARGPLSELEGETEIETQLISLDGLKRSVTLEAVLKENGGLTNYNVNGITVKVEISPILAEKNISGVPIDLIFPAGFAATVEPSKARLTIGGPAEMLDQLDVGKIKLTADARDLNSGKHRVSLSAALPGGMKVIRIEPAEVTVNLVAGNG